MEKSLYTEFLALPSSSCAVCAPRMDVFSSWVDAARAGYRKGAVCLGAFDGVHRGHQLIMSAAAERGPVVVFTFSPHPAKVLLPAGAAPPRIAATESNLRSLSRAGASAVILAPFTPTFARTEAPDFEDILFRILEARALVIGRDFTYGRGRKGNVRTLGEAAERAGAELVVVPPLVIGGRVVSSTWIRELVAAGDVGRTAGLLGRYYELDGEVVHGRAQGRELGFPTANLKARTELRPGNGIYAVRVRLPTGQWFDGAASVGTNPTFPNAASSIEVYILNFQGDLYGANIRVAFIERLREERRFESLTALVDQIRIDVEAVKQRLALLSPWTVADN